MAGEPMTADHSTSRWEDYVDVFFSPAELFERRAHDRLAPPLITLLLLAMAFYAIMLPATAAIMRAGMLENPEAAQAMSQFGTLFQVLGGIFVPVTYLVVIAFAATMLTFGGRMADVRVEFSRAMLIATYAAFVYLLAQIAGGVAVLVHGEAGLDVIRDTSFGVLRFVGDAQMDGALVAVLRRFEIFAIWQALLWAIGLRVIYRISFTRAGLIAAVTWIVFALPGLITGAFGPGGPGQG